MQKKDRDDVTIPYSLSRCCRILRLLYRIKHVVREHYLNEMKKKKQENVYLNH